MSQKRYFIHMDRILPNLSFALGWQYSDQSGIQNISTAAGTSETVTKRIHHILHAKVPGLNGEVAENVVEKLQRSGCLSIPFGEFVRDQFLRAPPSYLEMVSNCTADKLYHIFLENWGSSNCKYYIKVQKVYIGNSVMADITNISTWNEIFYGDGTSLEYTTNSLGYYPYGKDIITSGKNHFHEMNGDVGMAG